MDYNITTATLGIGSGMQEELPRPKTLIMDKETELTVELIEQLISDHKDQVQRFEILHNYYLGYASIQDRVRTDTTKPNNKLIAPYPSYATDVLTGMFIGEPVGYSVPEEFDAELAYLQEIFDFNDEQDENFEIAKYNSIMGVSYELIYVDENSLIRFNELDPRNVIYVYDNEINPEPLFAIYYVELEGDDREVYVFTQSERTIYRGSPLVEERRDINVIGLIPLLECSNNQEKMGDWERVLPLIDAYNKTISDTANDFEEFTNSFLVLAGMLNTEDEDITQMKQDRIILLDTEGSGQSAEWLVKEINDSALENHKKRLDEDIHRFTKIPNLTDDKFRGNSSGVALKYKLLALRQVIASKERKYKRFLQDRLEVILAYAEYLDKGLAIEHYDIDITFNPNIPVDEEANVRMVKDLLTITSENTALSQLFFIDNANAEQQKIEDERGAYNDALANYLYEDLLGGEDDSEPETGGADKGLGEDSRQRASQGDTKDSKED